jgi:(p)ppGpp synthase/HD superfamily hydrolase
VLLLKAVQFAGEKHKGQVRRGSGLPYVLHPASVAFILAENKSSKVLDELLAACMLHDTLEDTDTSFEELSTEFTPLVASLVLELTSDPREVETLGKNPYLIKKMLGMSNYALVIKLADRFSNILDKPSDTYKTDTLVMLRQLEEGRKLTASQLRLVAKIQEHLIETVP